MRRRAVQPEGRAGAAEAEEAGEAPSGRARSNLKLRMSSRSPPREAEEEAEW